MARRAHVHPRDLDLERTELLGHEHLHGPSAPDLVGGREQEALQVAWALRAVAAGVQQGRALGCMDVVAPELQRRHAGGHLLA